MLTKCIQKSRRFLHFGEALMDLAALGTQLWIQSLITSAIESTRLSSASTLEVLYDLSIVNDNEGSNWLPATAFSSFCCLENSRLFRKLAT